MTDEQGYAAYRQLIEQGFVAGFAALGAFVSSLCPPWWKRLGAGQACKLVGKAGWAVTAAYVLWQVLFFNQNVKRYGSHHAVGCIGSSVASAGTARAVMALTAGHPICGIVLAIAVGAWTGHMFRGQCDKKASEQA